jgi:small-conductance mechanosensitive channel
MIDMRSIGEALANLASTLGSRIADYLPNVVGAILLLIVGWALARILRALTIRAVLLLDKLFTQFGAAPTIERFRVGRASAVLGTVVFWLVILSFIAGAAQVLGLEAFTDWLKRLIDYLPTLIAGVLIIAAGWVVSRFAADFILATATRLASRQRTILARIAQVLILVGAIMVGADQIGIRITFLAIFIAAIASAVVGGVALAVGFGARDYIANLIGAHHLRQAFSVGQTVRIGDMEGRVLEVTATVLILETGEGRVTLPGRVYNEQPITVITRSASAVPTGMSQG